MNLIGISGKKFSGKDTIAHMLGLQYERKQFAGKLKQMTAILLGVPSHRLDEQEFKATSLGPAWHDLTPRIILQRIGTEIGRNLHEDIWITAAFADLHPLGNYVFTDVRFPNEADAIDNKGGILIRVERPGIISDDQHPSETALDNYSNWDYVIVNDGTIQNLADKVMIMMEKLGI